MNDEPKKNSNDDDNNNQPPLFESTTDPLSERRLARSFGYPKTWHVIRVAPHPSDPILYKNNNNINNTTTNQPLAHYNQHNSKQTPPPSRGTTCRDIIYAANPHRAVQPDCYYNHVAAMTAALKWKDEVDDPKLLLTAAYGDEGGQMISRVSLFEGGDWVEVYYEPDDMWYGASIVTVHQYTDDIRYTVHYTEDDATQSNVCEDMIRPSSKKKKKKKKKDKKQPVDVVPDSDLPPPPPPTPMVEGGETHKKQRKAMIKTTSLKSANSEQKLSKKKRKKYEDDVREGVIAAAEDVPEPPTKKSKKNDAPEHTANYEEMNDAKTIDNESASASPPPPPWATAETLAIASKIGLPPNWTASNRSNSRYEIRSADGTKRFRSKRAAFEYLGMEVPPPLRGGKLIELKKGAKKKAAMANFGGDDDGEKKRARKKKKKEDETDLLSPPPVTPKVEEEGDPPWRLSGHPLLNRRIRYLTPYEMTQYGTITGWISETDVDKEGQPGFISEHSGKPACLFHIVFDEVRDMDIDKRHLIIQSQDLEEYELADCLIDEGDEEGRAGVDDDEVPLSSIIQKKKVDKKKK